MICLDTDQSFSNFHGPQCTFQPVSLHLALFQKSFPELCIWIFFFCSLSLRVTVPSLDHSDLSFITIIFFSSFYNSFFPTSLCSIFLKPLLLTLFSAVTVIFVLCFRRDLGFGQLTSQSVSLSFIPWAFVSLLLDLRLSRHLLSLVPAFLQGCL